MGFKWIGKVAGGLLGGLVMGPIGAALGVLIGHQIDEQSAPAQPALSGDDLTAIGERFFRATFRVMGYLAKADGRVSEQEIAAARAVMAELRLGAEQAQEAIACFRTGKRADFDFAGEMAALGQACRGRPDLARIFLEIQVRAALAGNNLDGPVRALLARVGAALDVSAFEFAHIEAVLRIQRGGGRGGFAQAAGCPQRRRGARGGLSRARDNACGEQRGSLQGVPARSCSAITRTSSRPMACPTP